jgi:hypothetical protein
MGNGGGLMNEVTNISNALNSFLENEQIRLALADTIKENKNAIVLGSFVLGVVWILKDKNIKFNWKFVNKDLNTEQTINFETNTNLPES